MRKTPQLRRETLWRLLRKRCRPHILFCLATLLISATGLADVPTVGIEGQVEVLIPGSELKATPAERSAPISVRIASTRPHGSQVQYDLRYIGLVPGRYDLRRYLVREDGSTAENISPIEVEVTGILPPQHKGQLTMPRNQLLASLGGYRNVMLGAAVLWAILAVPVLLAGRRRKATDVPLVNDAPQTRADRLRPLVESASTGRLSTSEKAELERLLLAHWRQRIGLEDLPVSEALVRLREHPEAGKLLQALEDWLHRPPGSTAVDLDLILADYAKPELIAVSNGNGAAHSFAS